MSFELKDEAKLKADRRCDRCTNDRKKCSKDFNGCERCVLKGKPCTYLMKKKFVHKKDPLFEFKEFIHTLDFQSKKNVRECNYYNPNILYYKDVYLLKNGIHPTIFHLAKSFQLRSVFNVLTLIIGKELYSKPLNDIFDHSLIRRMYLIQIQENLNNEIEAQYSFLNPIAFNEWQISKVNDILIKAKLKYFQKFNSIFPLFLSNYLNSKERGIVLLSAIYCIGINYFDDVSEDKLIKKIKIIYENIIYEYLNQIITCIHLEDIQILVLLYLGLKKHSLFCKLIDKRYDQAIKAVFSLGLHKTYSKMSLINKIEAKLAYFNMVNIAAVVYRGYSHPTPFHFSLYDSKFRIWNLLDSLTLASYDYVGILKLEWLYHLNFLSIYISVYGRQHHNKDPSVYKSVLGKIRSKLHLAYQVYFNLKNNGLLEGLDTFLLLDDIHIIYQFRIFTILKDFNPENVSLFKTFISNLINRIKRIPLNMVNDIHLGMFIHCVSYYSCTFDSDYFICSAFKHLSLMSNSKLTHTNGTKMLRLIKSILDLKDKSTVKSKPYLYSKEDEAEEASWPMENFSR